MAVNYGSRAELLSTGEFPISTVGVLGELGFSTMWNLRITWTSNPAEYFLLTIFFDVDDDDDGDDIDSQPAKSLKSNIGGVSFC